ncbi:hypothetical protein ACFLW1_01795 [Chloroflexota bacterium]
MVDGGLSGVDAGVSIGEAGDGTEGGDPGTELQAVLKTASITIPASRHFTLAFIHHAFLKPALTTF